MEVYRVLEMVADDPSQTRSYDLTWEELVERLPWLIQVKGNAKLVHSFQFTVDEFHFEASLK